MEEDFETWLKAKLTNLKIDESVFAPYICGVLEGEDDVQNQKEDLLVILEGLRLEEDIQQSLLTEIFQRYKIVGNHVGTSSIDSSVESTLSNRMAKLLDDAEKETNKNRNGPGDVWLAQSPDAQLRSIILSHSREVEIEGTGESSVRGLERNINVEKVINEQKQKRENDKLEHAKKRSKDKEDRARQKQLEVDRKEKAKKKTTKVERKR